MSRNIKGGFLTLSSVVGIVGMIIAAIEFSDLNLCPINNRQGIVIDGEGSKVICKD